MVFNCAVFLGGVPRTRLLHLAAIDRIETNAGDARCFLRQIARELAAFPRHHLTCGQRETERIGLIVKIKNDLSRHVDFSLG